MSLKRLNRLMALSAIKRDMDLAELARLAAARTETRTRLEALRNSVNAPVAADPVLMSVQQRHRLWAEAQRAELNMALARQQAAWLEARDRTRRSFGRASVLERLAQAQGVAAKRHTPS